MSADSIQFSPKIADQKILKIHSDSSRQKFRRPDIILFLNKVLNNTHL